MTELTTLFKQLVCAQYNLRVLHWKVKGKGFSKTHLDMDDHTDKFNEFIDTVAEMMLSYGTNPPALADCIGSIRAIDPSENFDTEDTIKNMMSMYDTLIKEISVVKKDSCPSAFASKLDEIQYWLIIESRYKGVRIVM